MLTSFSHFYPQNLSSPPYLFPLPSSPPGRANSLSLTLEAEIASATRERFAWALPPSNFVTATATATKKKSRWGPRTVLANSSVSTGLPYLLLAYRTLAYSGSGSPHFIRAPHRTTEPRHHHQGTKSLQPVLSRHWRSPSHSRPPLSFFLRSTSLFGPPPRIEHFLCDNSTHHLSSSIATLHTSH